MLHITWLIQSDPRPHPPSEAQFKGIIVIILYCILEGITESKVTGLVPSLCEQLWSDFMLHVAWVRGQQGTVIGVADVAEKLEVCCLSPAALHEMLLMWSCSSRKRLVGISSSLRQHFFWECPHRHPVRITANKFKALSLVGHRLNHHCVSSFSNRGT